MCEHLKVEDFSKIDSLSLEKIYKIRDVLRDHRRSLEEELLEIKGKEQDIADKIYEIMGRG